MRWWFAQAFEDGPSEPAGRPLEPAGDGRPRWMAAASRTREVQDPAYRSTRPSHPGSGH